MSVTFLSSTSLRPFLTPPVRPPPFVPAVMPPEGPLLGMSAFVVASILCAVGDQVAEGAELLRIE